MAGPNPSGNGGGHPIHIHPVRPLYRYSATLLGASMWFFVGSKDIRWDRTVVDFVLAILPNEEGWPGTVRLEAPMGALGDGIQPFTRVMRLVQCQATG
jgi:hypothetical protein